MFSPLISKQRYPLTRYRTAPSYDSSVLLIRNMISSQPNGALPLWRVSPWHSDARTAFTLALCRPLAGQTRLYARGAAMYRRLPRPNLRIQISALDRRISQTDPLPTLARANGRRSILICCTVSPEAGSAAAGCVPKMRWPLFCGDGICGPAGGCNRPAAAFQAVGSFLLTIPTCRGPAQTSMER